MLLNKIVGTAVAVTLCVTAVMGGSVLLAQKQTEKSVSQVAGQSEAESRRSISDYEFALELKTNFKDNPLYYEEGMMGGESLEGDIDDIFAFHGARKIIDEVCKAAGIDGATATIDDLSVEQLVEIQEKAFETSPHGK